MTLDELRALCDAPGWSTGRVARAVGRAADTLRKWQRGQDLGGPAADWLARVHAITAAPTTDRPHRVLLDVDAPPGPERT